MSILLTIVHIIVAVGLILFVLLQAGKGAGIGAAFGGSSETLFGTSGPQGLMSKLTTAAAVIFMVTSLLLSIYGARTQTRSIVPTEPLKQPTTSAPATPGAPAPTTQESGQPGTK